MNEQNHWGSVNVEHQSKEKENDTLHRNVTPDNEKRKTEKRERTIWVGGLPNQYKLKELYEKFSTHGKIVDIRRPPQSGSRDREFVFIEYGKQEEANTAVEIENGADYMDGILDVDAMKPRREVRCRFKKTIWIGGLPNGTSKNDLEARFSVHGGIISIQVVSNPVHDFAFIKFSETAAAVAAIQDENGKLFSGQKIIVEFQGKRLHSRSRSRSPLSSRARSLTKEGNGGISKKIFVNHGCSILRKDEIEDIFGIHGKITDIETVSIRSCIIQYENIEDAKKALKEEDGLTYFGKKIRVYKSRR